MFSSKYYYSNTEEREDVGIHGVYIHWNAGGPVTIVAVGVITFLERCALDYDVGYRLG